MINFQQRCVDIEGTICLDEGMLELIACTKGSKEHESIVAIAARPMHIHTALLLLGANNGNPATSRPADEQKTRWIDIPPQGDPVNVYLVFEDIGRKDGRAPHQRFCRSNGWASREFAADENDAEEDCEFPDTFLFAGSHLRDNGPGPRQYLADLSGNVISIATFGDELLCLPGMHSQGQRCADVAGRCQQASQGRLEGHASSPPAKKPAAKADDRQRGQSTDDRQKDQK